MSRHVFYRPPEANGYVCTAHLCMNPSCDRMACTHSEPGFSEYCCKACAVNGYGQHVSGCDENHPKLSARRVSALVLGDRVEIYRPGAVGVPETVGVVMANNHGVFTLECRRTGSELKARVSRDGRLEFIQ